MGSKTGIGFALVEGESEILPRQDQSLTGKGGKGMEKEFLGLLKDKRELKVAPWKAKQEGYLKRDSCRCFRGTCLR